MYFFNKVLPEVPVEVEGVIAVIFLVVGVRVVKVIISPDEQRLRDIPPYRVPDTKKLRLK